MTQEGRSPSASTSARARVRAELTAEIKSAASLALARDGASGLSLRAVARDLGMVPSALYRYFPSRDQLLTELIIDAYHSLADTLEAAVADDDGLGPWQAAALALRGWAFARPQEWALLYGSPVPGYHAPERTVPAALRVPQVFATVAETAWTAGGLGPGTDVAPGDGAVAAVAPIAEGLPSPLPLPIILQVLAGWEQLAGAVSLELFGHFSGGLTDADAVFAYVADASAGRVGFPPAVP